MGEQELLERIEALEGRVRALEDELAVGRLVTAYGPAVDTGDGATAAALWVEDGEYDVSGTGHLRGRAAIEGMLMGEGHQSMVPGCAHVNGPSMVRVDGDDAVAVGYSRVYRTDDGRHRMFRMAANRWELTRTADGWRAVRRVNRQLGTDASLEVLRSAFE